MSAFHATAFLSSPMGTYGERPMLDSLLAYAWFLESTGGGSSRLLRSDEPTDPDPDTFPLDIVVQGGFWWWDGTAGDGQVVAHESRSRRKSFQSKQAHVHTTARRANRAAGLLKSMDLPTPTVLVDHVSFYGRGDPGRALYLLDRYVHGLGKRRNAGLGFVQRWDVEEVEEVPVMFAGHPQRPIPADLHPGTNRRMTRIRPPYWHRSDRVLCACPPDWGSP